MVKAWQSRSLRGWLLAVVITAALGAAPAAGGEPPSLLETGGSESSEIDPAATLSGSSDETQANMLADPADGAINEYDPWERFNERMFECSSSTAGSTGSS